MLAGFCCNINYVSRHLKLCILKNNQPGHHSGRGKACIRVEGRLCKAAKSCFAQTFGKLQGKKTSQLCPSPSLLENGHGIAWKQLSKQRSGMMDAVPFSNDGLQGI